MKKSIIAAGAASVALAAMPIVSTFAAVSTYDVRDNIVLTINNTCSLTRSGSTTGETVSGSSAFAEDGTLPTGMEISGTYTADMAAGGNGVIGVSTIGVTCNDVKNGHTLTVATTPLTATAASTGLSENFPTIDYSNSSVVPTGGAAQTSGWNITVGGNTELGITADTILSAAGGSATIYPSSATLKKSVADETFTATYSVGASANQTAGTYEGSATYTLTWGA